MDFKLLNEIITEEEFKKEHTLPKPTYSILKETKEINHDEFLFEMVRGFKEVKNNIFVGYLMEKGTLKTLRNYQKLLVVELILDTTDLLSLSIIKTRLKRNDIDFTIVVGEKESRIYIFDWNKENLDFLLAEIVLVIK